MAKEILWGNTQNDGGSIVTNNPANMIDLAFNDIVADFAMSAIGSSQWATFQPTTRVDFGNLVSATLNVRFRTTGAMTDGNLRPRFRAGGNNNTLTNYNSGNQSPTSLTTVSFNVLSLLTSIADINGCDARLRNNTADTSGISCEIDECSLELEWLDIEANETIAVAESVSELLDVLNIDLFEPFGVLITEAISVIDLVVEVGVTPDFIMIAEAVTGSLTELYGTTFDAIALAEEPTLGVTVDVDVQEPIAITENAQVSTALELSVNDAVAITETNMIEAEIGFSVFEVSGLLVTEVAEIIDLVVEVGVVAEIVLLTEQATASIDVLHQSVFEVINTAENVNAIFDVLNVSVSDAVGVTENAQAEKGDNSLTSESNVTVAENIQASLDNLNMDTNEAILITEVAQIVDLIIEVGVVAEPIVVSDALTLNLGELFVDVLDAIGVAEAATVLKPEHDSAVDDTVATAEDIQINLDALNSEGPQETIGITEQVTLGIASIADIEVNVNDAITATEQGAASLDVLNTQSDENITVAEQAQAFDLVIELGPVFETVTTTEQAQAEAPLEANVSDSVSVTEQATPLINTLSVIVFEITAVSDYTEVTDLVVEVGVLQEPILISEQVTALIPEIFLSADDTVAVTEQSQASLDVLAINEEDSLTAQDILVGLDIAFGIDVNEAITIVEFAQVLDIGVELFAQETIGIVEDVQTSFFVPTLFVNVTDSVTAVSFVITPLGVIVGDDVGVTGALVDYLNVQEFVAGEVFLEVIVQELITITELAQTFDIIIELGIVVDTVSVTDEAEGIIPVLSLAANEVITVTEATDTFSLLDVDVNDSILLLDDVLVRDADITAPEIIEKTIIFEVTPRKRIFIIKNVGNLVSR